MKHFTLIHCTTTAPLYSLHYTAPPLLHCTVLTTLHCTHYSALCSLHRTTTTPLHCTHFTVCSDPHLIKAAKILSRDINERVFWIIFTLNDVELIYYVQIWICSCLNIHNLQRKTDFQNAQNLKRFIISFLSTNSQFTESFKWVQIGT